MEFWRFNDTPASPGWYAVLVYYEAEEGAFPQAAHWDGKEWGRKAVVAFGESRLTEQEAEDLAYEHDPDA